MRTFVFAVILAVSALSYDTASKAEKSIDPGKLAECLTATGAKMYSAGWCGPCKEQKRLFGKAVTKLTIVECQKEIGGPVNPACHKLDIHSVPTWILGDGTRLRGYQTLEELSEAAKCPSK